ncbi:YihY family inner membrane protein [Aequitasia blattaphilus]|uniref:YihY/virulence factor BrkB family protein n=1 Tax=Aequitasia blattaphilus TaxID=2949332 RepID=A0ABT1E6T6_9FIRM|nr:YihY/virulence factor BrkB family protein [Aequitasia blattaphilus]MCP1101478.1 YihY/virulence factor BrkB family protein [Aequitasia blattaphilus]MCR8614118.1 YihY/virulence factor BrkB family protein [Aequitasia blattaphilus]
MNGKKIKKNVVKFIENVEEHKVGAFAAQSAFFFVICMIPIILLLFTMVKYTPLTKRDILSLLLQLFPDSVSSLVTSMVNQVYNQSLTTIPFTVIAAVWSAARGVMAVSTGLNNVYTTKETRSYVYIRLRAGVYTVFFIFIFVLILVVSVFGRSLKDFIISHAPFMEQAIEKILQAQSLLTPIIVLAFTLLIFSFLPNRKTKLRFELPGAVFTTIGWITISTVFSIYLDIFKGFASMYGSLTTIILIMLWMYFCMYCILLGAELNVLWFPKAEEETKKELDN